MTEEIKLMRFKNQSKMGDLPPIVDGLTLAYSTRPLFSKAPLNNKFTIVEDSYGYHYEIDNQCYVARCGKDYATIKEAEDNLGDFIKQYDKLFLKGMSLEEFNKQMKEDKHD